RAARRPPRHRRPRHAARPVPQARRLGDDRHLHLDVHAGAAVGGDAAGARSVPPRGAARPVLRRRPSAPPPLRGRRYSDGHPRGRGAVARRDPRAPGLTPKEPVHISPPVSDRLSWDQYFLTITRTVAERSTCLRAKVGAVIV